MLISAYLAAMQRPCISFKRHRFPPQIIAQTVLLMKRYDFAPKRIITDKLRSFGAAKREVAPGLEHRSHKGLNNRAENSHLPFRKRERTMQGYRSPGGLQRFVSVSQLPETGSPFHPSPPRPD